MSPIGLEFLSAITALVLSTGQSLLKKMFFAEPGYDGAEITLFI